MNDESSEVNTPVATGCRVGRKLGAASVAAILGIEPPAARSVEQTASDVAAESQNMKWEIITENGMAI